MQNPHVGPPGSAPARVPGKAQLGRPGDRSPRREVIERRRPGQQQVQETTYTAPAEAARHLEDCPLGQVYESVLHAGARPVLMCRLPSAWRSSSSRLCGRPRSCTARSRASQWSRQARSVDRWQSSPDSTADSDSSKWHRTAAAAAPSCRGGSAGSLWLGHHSKASIRTARLGCEASWIAAVAAGVRLVRVAELLHKVAEQCAVDLSCYTQSVRSSARCAVTRAQPVHPC